MTQRADRLEIFTEIVENAGREALKKAAEEILNSKFSCGIVSSAAKYHAEFLDEVTPISQALMALSCEVAGGEKGKTTNVAAAISILIEASNVHDDIIDHTTTKYSRKTVFGKFGGDIALLVGDLFLAQGTMLLCKACQKLPKEQEKTILETTFETLVKVSNSVALETGMRKNFGVTSQEYLKVIQLKASAPEAHCKIGGILGNGSKRIIQTLGQYGKTYGLLGNVTDEFLDLLNYDKLRGRVKNECLPLPILLSLEDSRIKKDICTLIKDFYLTRKTKNQIIKMVLGSEKVQRLQKDIVSLAEKEVEQMKNYKESDAVVNLITLINTVKEVLWSIS